MLLVPGERKHFLKLLQVGTGQFISRSSESRSETSQLGELGRSNYFLQDKQPQQRQGDLAGFSEEFGARNGHKLQGRSRTWCQLPIRKYIMKITPLSIKIKLFSFQVIEIKDHSGFFLLQKSGRRIFREGHEQAFKSCTPLIFFSFISSFLKKKKNGRMAKATDHDLCILEFPWTSNPPDIELPGLPAGLQISNLQGAEQKTKKVWNLTNQTKLGTKNLSRAWETFGFGFHQQSRI